MKNIEYMAVLKGDSSLWTPEQALEALKTQGYNMKQMVCIFTYEVNGAGKMDYWSAGISTRFEHIGLVSSHLHAHVAETLSEPL